MQTRLEIFFTFFPGTASIFDIKNELKMFSRVEIHAVLFLFRIGYLTNTYEYYEVHRQSLENYVYFY